MKMKVKMTLPMVKEKRLDGSKANLYHNYKYNNNKKRLNMSNSLINNYSV